MRLVVSARYIPIAFGVMSLVTFVTNESGAAHERGVRKNSLSVHCREYSSMSNEMKTRCMKHVVYKYTDGQRSDELEFDRTGKLAFMTGDIISRHGISWRIESAKQEQISDNLMGLPTYWVYLTRVVKNRTQ